jgi:hypothetical protein
MSNLSQFGAAAPSLKSATTTVSISTAAAPSAGQVLRATSSTAATWQAPPQGLTLLATLTPTAAANLDFLTAFSSTYDNYLILGQGINFAADQRVAIRLAVAGAVDTASNYVDVSNEGINSSITSTSLNLHATNMASTGKGSNFSIELFNVNSGSQMKSLKSDISYNDSTNTSSIRKIKFCTYFGTSVVTGFRLFGDGASNFAATGKVRVYGYANT